MAGSIWERVGEGIGYGLAAVVLGPQVALERRARRAMRTSMLAFCKELQPLKLEVRPGKIRRRVTLPSATGGMSLDIELDLHARIATLTTGIERLPAYVEARVTTFGKGAGTPRAVSESLQLHTDTLDGEAATALVEMMAAGPLARSDALDIGISPELVVLLGPAPTTVEGWALLRDGLVAISSWLTRRWPASYRA